MCVALGLLLAAPSVQAAATPAPSKSAPMKSGPPADYLVWGTRGNRSPCTAIQCTKEQRLALRASLATMTQTIAQAQAAAHALKVQLAEVLRAPTLDQGALDKVFADLAEQRNKIATARKDALIQIHAQLTPEQRAKLADRLHRPSQSKELALAQADHAKPDKEKPVKEKPVKDKPAKEKPLKENPSQEKSAKSKAAEQSDQTPASAKAANPTPSTAPSDKAGKKSGKKEKPAQAERHQ